MINIIIPVYLFNEHILDITQRCFQSLKDTTQNPFQIIWVDNGSNHQYFEHLKDYVITARIPCKIIRNNTNLGYTKAINQGIQYALSPLLPLCHSEPFACCHSERAKRPKNLAQDRPQAKNLSFNSSTYRFTNSYIVLANNDIIASIGWDIALIKVLQEHPEIGCITPMADATCITQKQTEIYKKYGRDKEYIIPDATISFFFTLFKTEVIQKVGLLDERLANGWGTDGIYCHKMRQAGYLPAIHGQVTFHHEHKTTFRHIYGDNVELERLKAKKNRNKLYPHGIQ